MSTSTGTMPRPSIKIGAGAVVCVEAELRGDITIGPRTVIHPRARIIAEAGPIVIGESNLVEDQVVIINRKQLGQEGPITMTIGANNVFEVGSRCEAVRVGNNNVVESKAFIGRDTEMSNGCVIGAFCNITSHERLPEHTVIFGDECRRRLQADKPQAQTLQLDFLMKILPNYHHLKKSTKTKSVEKS
ncbi:dynactin subunit 6 [Strongylocentrotus purpuratus]|uniref:Dynactin subunit 6 n=1 Tax=Strongylocentrotus purpuratus TaxID=7668 RepID=A0A7M7RGT5_STRPU|nr:dynactin subunit 6 [Strongylocentrotus purpuratus]|eukprot:XP_786640.2 PREDICTED: dynactin subunit 6 [Strongylocentrotus purpuratus]